MMQLLITLALLCGVTAGFNLEAYLLANRHHIVHDLQAGNCTVCQIGVTNTTISGSCALPTVLGVNAAIVGSCNNTLFTATCTSNGITITSSPVGLVLVNGPTQSATLVCIPRIGGAGIGGCQNCDVTNTILEKSGASVDCVADSNVCPTNNTGRIVVACTQCDDNSLSDDCCILCLTNAACGGAILTDCACRGVPVACPACHSKDSNKLLLLLLLLLLLIPLILLLLLCCLCLIRRRKRGQDSHLSTFEPVPQHTMVPPMGTHMPCPGPPMGTHMTMGAPMGGPFMGGAY